MDYLIYNGIDSRSLGVYVARANGEPLVYNISPPSRAITEKIAGRHGTIVMEQLYEPRQIDVTLFFTDISQNTMRLISQWLGALGEKQLWLSTEPYKLYYATVEQQLNPSIMNIKQGMMEVSFTCYNPIGYSSFLSTELEGGFEYNDGWIYNTGIPYVDSGLLKYTFTSGDLPDLDVYHGGNVGLALPRITITGSGTNITISRYSDSARTDLVQQCTYGAFSGSLLIDSFVREAYLNGVINNATFDGDYFTLDGIPDLEYEDLGTGSDQTQTSIKLGSTASSVNDFYNGMVLALISSIDSQVIYKTIIDYDGATKTAYFSTTPSIGELPTYNYFVYSLDRKMNYFEITGTGLSITNVVFDFRFTYL